MSKKQFQQLDNRVLAMATARERRLKKSYQGVLNELRAYFSSMVDKYGNADGTIDFAELNKYGRFQAGRDQIARQTNFLYDQLLSDIKTDLRQVYELSYATTAGILEEVTGSPVAGKLRLGVLEKAINTPVGGLTIDLRLEQLQLDITNRLTRSITTGVAQGKSWRGIANDLKNDMEGNLSSIQRIVRTEGHRLEETAKYDNALKSRKPLVKMWVSERDSFVRDGHKLMDGVVVGMEEMFQSPYGGSGLYPSMMGTAEDDINCRCFVNYVLKEAVL